MATCARCGTIMAGTPGAKCPSCGAVNNARPVADVPAAPRAVPTAPTEPPPPHESPAPRATASRPLPTAIEKVALGLTLIMWAAAALLLAIIAAMASPEVGSVFQFACFALALAGVLLIGTGEGLSVGTRVVHAILMFLPLANLILALVMASRAMHDLKAAGYTIGFMSVKR
jgi:hypothetical protein